MLDGARGAAHSLAMGATREGWRPHARSRARAEAVIALLFAGSCSLACAPQVPGPDAGDDGGAGDGAIPDGDVSDAGEPVDGSVCSVFDEDGDGRASVPCGGDDCDDADAARFPLASERCDGIDGDCDGRVDEGTGRCPISVAAGTWISHLVLADGTAYSVGASADGALGTGPPDDRGVRYEPTFARIEGLLDVRSIVTATRYGCALHTTGLVSCWGDNEAGQLGDGTQTSRWEPRPVSALDDAIAVEVGPSAACAIRRGGTVSCWGSRLVVASGPPTDCTACRREVPELDGAIALAVGSRHQCALRADGTVWCWGHNGLRQLGDGVARHIPLPVDAPGLEDRSPVPVRASVPRAHAIAALGDTTFAATEDGVWAWGGTEFGLLGDGLVEHAPCDGRCVLDPVRVTGVGHVEDFGGQFARMCTLERGGIHCWGQLGTRTVVTPEPSDENAPPGLLSFVASPDHMCGLAAGRAYCWGMGDLFQLGDGLYDYSSRGPVELVAP